MYREQHIACNSQTRTGVAFTGSVLDTNLLLLTDGCLLVCIIGAG